MNLGIKLIFSLSLLFKSFFSFAGTSYFYQENPYKFTKFSNFGVSTGGDKYSDSLNNLTLDAGAGYTIGGGVDINHKENPFGVKLFTNYHINKKSGNGAYISLTRFGLGAIAYGYVTDKINIGAGLSFHLSTDYENQKSKYFLVKERYDTAVAKVVEISYLYSDKIQVSTRYNWVEYADEIDASNIGVYLTYYIKK